MAYIAGNEFDNSLFGTNGDDTLDGFGGNDMLAGIDGNDALYGGEGNDNLSATATQYWNGSDTTYLPSGNNLMDGGAGEDTLQSSGGGNDTLLGRDGNDYLSTYTAFFPNGNSYTYITPGTTYMEGGEGNDTLTAYGSAYWDGNNYNYVPSGNHLMDGGIGNDFLQTYGDGNNTLLGGEGNDSLNAAAAWYWNGNSVFHVSSGSDLVDGGAGNDILSSNGGGNDTLLGGDGNDNLNAATAWHWNGNSYYYISSGNVFLDGGAGEDTLQSSGGGNDTLLGGDGSDFLATFASSNMNGNSYYFVASGPDLLDGGAGDDTLQSGGGGNDTLLGGDGNDNLSALSNSYWNGNSYIPYSGNAFMDGGNGNDILRGGNGSDTLFGGNDNDLLSGGTGADEYHFRGAFGLDTIAANAANVQDRVVFEEISHGQITTTLSGADLVLTYDAGNTVTIQGWGQGINGGSLNQFSFSDGNYVLDANRNWQRAEPKLLIGGEGQDTLVGGFGNDTLQGGNSSDILVGLGRNDLLTGGAGNDTYYYGFATQSNGVWTLGYFGNDTITGGVENANDWIVVDNIDGSAPYRSGNDLVLTVGDNTGNSSAGTITLQDWLTTDAGNQIHHLTMRDGYRYFGVGSDAIDYYFDVDTSGNGVSRSFAGNSQNLMYYGLEGNDTVIGGEGKDWFSGDVGDDSLSGGNGDDNLYGGSGNDGLSGGGGNDMLRGGVGNDTLSGGAGSDVYRFGSATVYNGELFGNDVILSDSNNSEDVLYLRNMDMPASAVKINNDLKLNLTNGSITMQGWFTDGAANQIHNVKYNDTSANTNYLGVLDVGDDSDNVINDSGNSANLLLYGLGGNDVLTGSAGNDYLTGGTGNDILSGGVGNDTYYFGFATQSGNGPWTTPAIGNDTIRASSDNAGDRIIVDNLDGFTISGNDLILKVWDSGTVSYIGTITLENYLLADAGQRIHNVTIRDGSRAYGSGNTPHNYYFDVDVAGNNLITFADSAGNQMYLGWNGNDTIAGGSGSDWLTGDAGNDVISGGSGDDDLFGGNENDYLSGGAGNDMLRGNAGSDTLSGGAGNDIYRFGSGMRANYNADVNGNDVIVSDASNANDTLYFKNTSMTSDAHQAGNDLILDYWNDAEDKTYTLTLQNWYGEGFINVYRQGYDLDASGYSENTSYLLRAGSNSSDISDYTGSYNPIMAFGLDGNDIYHGGEMKDRVWGGNGADTIYGGSGDDNLKGQTGDDSLFGEAGNDVLYGGTGNDWLSGGNGVDSYWFGNSDPTVAKDDLGNDTIAGAADNFQDNLQLHNIGQLLGADKSGNDLRLNYLNTDPGGTFNTITLQSWFNGQEYKIQTLSNQQGNTTSSFLLQAGTDADDNVNCGNSSAVMYFGLGGNDTVYGSSYADVLFGGAGSDLFMGGAGNDTYVFSGAWGQDSILADGVNPNASDTVVFAGLTHNQVSVGSNGNDLILSYGDGNGVDIANWLQGADNKLNNFVFNDGNYAVNVGMSWSPLDGVKGTEGDDWLNYSENTTDVIVFGLGGNDTIIGGIGNDYLDGGIGNDTLVGGLGFDSLVGGDGDDLLLAGSYSSEAYASIFASVPGFHNRG